MRQPIISDLRASAKRANDYETITISWKTECAKYVSLNGVHVCASGTKEIPVAETITLKASNDNGRIEKSISIKVSYPIQISKFSIKNDHIALGKNCTVRWTGRNIRKVSLQGKDYSAIGPIIFKPTVSGNYEVVFEGIDGDIIKKSFALHIIYPPPIINVNAPDFAKFGDKVHVDWDTKFVSSVKIDGIEQPLTGSFEWTFSEASTEKSMIFVDMDGEIHEKKISVREALPPRILSFGSNVKEINDNQSVTLNWTTENANYVSLNGTRVAANGSRECPAECEYRLKVSNKFGATASTIKVNVLHQVQITTFKAKTTELKYGSPCVVKWTGSNVKNIYVDGKRHRAISPLAFTPKESRPYTIKFEGRDADVVEKTIDVNVIVPEPILNIETPEYGVPGKTVKITWQTDNVKSVTIGDMNYPLNGSFEWRYEEEDYSRTLLITKVDDTTYEKTIEIRPAHAPEIDSIILSEEKVKIGNFCRLSWSGNYVEKWFLEGKSTQSGNINSIHVKITSEVLKVHFVGEDGTEIIKDVNVELIPKSEADTKAEGTDTFVPKIVTRTWEEILLNERAPVIDDLYYMPDAKVTIDKQEVNSGESCTVRWSSNDAQYVTVNGVTRSMSQWYTFSPSCSQSITVVFYGRDGKICERSVYIKVKEPEKSHEVADDNMGCIVMMLMFLIILIVFFASIL